MSTRCTIHFGDQYGVDAIIYRHSDGYPDGEHGVPATLERFFETVEEQTEDTRYQDPSYLAAKFLVYQADLYSKTSYSTYTPGGGYDESKAKPLDFLSVAPILKDPADIEYRYTVHSDRRDSKGRPEVTWEDVLS
jgi:hypothetical protein